jgi:alkanesulfonate monooxygenase SsuD/methylene tetrahydromethanopterin reductase-like flavin-dependent oxidoreductase (luciferase family)
VIKNRWAVDLPSPIRNPIPILIGGDGEKITLRLVAQYADAWNSTGTTPQGYKHKSSVLAQWCDRVGRDYSSIERTVSVVESGNTALFDEYVASGAQHIIINLGAPWDLTPVERLLRWREQFD